MARYKRRKDNVGSRYCRTLLLKYLKTQTHCRDEASLNKRFTLPRFDV